MIQPQCLVVLQTLLSEDGVALLEPSLLERFYKHCLRQPVAVQSWLRPISFNALLYQYEFLRPERQELLAGFIREQWRRFAPEAPMSDEPPEPTETEPESMATPADPPSRAQWTQPRPPRQDWFDRLLDTIRILFFL